MKTGVTHSWITKARVGRGCWVLVRKGHLTSEVGGQRVRMGAECTGLWVWLEERKFSFKNSFLCRKGIGGGEGKEV